MFQQCTNLCEEMLYKPAVFGEKEDDHQQLSRNKMKCQYFDTLLHISTLLCIFFLFSLKYLGNKLGFFKKF